LFEPDQIKEKMKMNCKARETGKNKVKWQTMLAIASLLICPLTGAAQSKTGRSDGQQKSGDSEGREVQVRIWDACDPDTFNAKVGPGTCQPGHHGQTNFDDFFGEVTSDKIAGGWRFNPLLNTDEGVLKLIKLDLKEGDRISLQNVGGETHTFTRVEEFAGGFFPPLNPLSGNPDPAPECALRRPDGTLAPQPESDTNEFVAAGTTELGPVAGTAALPRGTTHWQCCIHPWMRMNIVVRDQDHDHGPDQPHQHDHQP
jgi:hypothetical protein